MGMIRKAAVLALAGAIGASAVVSLAPPAQAATVVANLHPHSRFGGTPKVLLHGNNGYVCSLTWEPVDAAYPTLEGFNDVTSSFKSFSWCATKLFEHPEFRDGGETSWAIEMSFVGSAMNDRASSALIS